MRSINGSLESNQDVDVNFSTITLEYTQPGLDFDPAFNKTYIFKENLCFLISLKYKFFIKKIYT